MKCSECGIESENESGFISTGSRMTRVRSVCLTCLSYKQLENSKTHAREFTVGLVIGVIFLLNKDSPWFFLNLYMFIAMMYLSIIPHELGHALGAVLTKGKLLEISFGQGRLVYSRKIYGIYIGFRVAPVEGFVRYFHTDKRFIRIKSLLVSALGPGVNIAIFFILLHVFNDVIDRESFSKTPAPVFTFAIANLFVGALNLIPFKAQTQIGLLESDGLSMFKSVFSRDLPLLNESEQRLVQAHIAFQYRDIETYKALSEQGMKLDDKDIHARFSYSVAIGALGDYSGAARILEDLLNFPDLDDNLRAIAQSNLVYNYLLIGKDENYDRAFELIDAAMARCPWELSVRSNYGGLHVVAGDVDKGLDVLIDRRFAIRPLSEQAEILSLIALGYAKLGNYDKAREKLAEAKNMDSDCKFSSAVEKLLENQGNSD